ncbi:MAG: non-canonical purine NTP pyrophosphatase [Phycisphaerales bacterium]|nr:non-canonical purine NTP pyrophosphatase [Phycisphaerales bacterium]
MRRIVIATGNPKKVEELRAILAEAMGDGGPEVLGLADLPGADHLTEPEEHHDERGSFEGNARLKAVGYAAQTGLPCLADDSGLEVDSLGGRPGVISSHYSTGGVETGLSREERDGANNRKLLEDLAGVPLERRTARFVCVMALAMPGDPPKVVLTSRGEFEGRIGLPEAEAGGRAELVVPRGEGGFGYDPLLLLPDPETRSGAELLPEEKNRLSHRGKAARAMVERIGAMLAER